MKLSLALLQTNVAEDKAKNISSARGWLSRAADKGAELAVLPEMFANAYQPKTFAEHAEPLDGGICETLSQAARSHGMWIVGGSFVERQGDMLFNTCPVFSGAGELVAAYRKAHLFDVSIQDGAVFQESRWVAPGSESVVVQAQGFRLGVAICYDVRFPEWFRMMQGAELIVLPAAFHQVTGAAHWELLLRARALDNQCYFAGAAPARHGNRVFQPYAHSMLCNPWGAVVEDAGEGERMLLREIDFDEVATVRRELPVLQNRRHDLYIYSS